MRFQTQVDIDAGVEAVWRVLTDVEDWPKWTASMTSVQRLERGELGVGSSARVVQPKLKAAVYTVTECEPGKSFTWEMKTTGVKVRAGHDLEDLGGGRTRMVLSVEQSGALSGLVAALFGKRAREYVSMEAQGLKKAAESLATGTGAE
ncbi:SRPBCC family protein [Catenulispora subtropica]|uniref:Cyclase/dehydrase n=1 Tax=Catenulispora subtropica TaxID=450798 RepID=A0ABN2SN77_9ACTN